MSKQKNMLWQNCRIKSSVRFWDFASKVLKNCHAMKGIFLYVCNCVVFDGLFNTVLNLNLFQCNTHSHDQKKLPCANLKKYIKSSRAIIKKIDAIFNNIQPGRVTSRKSLKVIRSQMFPGKYLHSLFKRYLCTSNA